LDRSSQEPGTAAVRLEEHQGGIGPPGSNDEAREPAARTEIEDARGRSVPGQVPSDGRESFGVHQVSLDRAGTEEASLTGLGQDVA
jgi:hypothetical protein